MSKLIRAISENGGVIIYAIDATDIVKEAQTIHKTSATVSAALGRLLTGATLMGATLKNETDTLSLRVVGDGAVGMLYAETNARGQVRGYAENPYADLPATTQGKLDVGGIVGNGTLYVIKNLGLKEPQTGMVPLVSGEIAEDITSYYAHSEQIPTVCALGVLVDTDLSVLNAGGYLLQLLPGATEEEITMLENNIASMQSVTSYLNAGKTIYDIINDAMNGFYPNILDEENVFYDCSCNAERFEHSLIALGKSELEDIATENDDIEIQCHFCSKKYHFKASRLLQQLEN